MKKIFLLIMACFLITGSRSGFSQESPLDIIHKKDGSHMILIPGGNFEYGMDKKDRERVLRFLSNALLPIFDLEFPKQTQFLPPYYIDKYEITNRQYNKFIKETGHRKPRFLSSKIFNKSDQPVVGIGWSDAEAYAKWAGKRLPSEEEWEKASRGIDGRIWPWGNQPSGKKYNGRIQGYYSPVKVGSYPSGASPYGVMDMAGNVYEMTTGIWGKAGRAMRGGCYLNSGAYTRTMFRWAPDDEENGVPWLGFRCVMDVKDVKKIDTPSVITPHPK